MTDLQKENRELAAAAAKVLLEKAGVEKFDIALTLGSGWGKSAEALGEIFAEIPADEVPGFHANGVIGHSGKLTGIRLADGRNVLIIGARTHLYEGRGVDAVAHGVRTAHAAGVETLVLTNGAGGVNPAFGPGDVMLITDHINLTALSPLKGAEFVDLTDLYEPAFREIVRAVEPDVREGVYVQLPGPHFETPAEIRFLQTIGGDAVGMSTALEAITARSLGMRILGLSFITNPAAGLQEEPLSHEDVIAAGKAAEGRLSELLSKVVAKLP